MENDLKKKISELEEKLSEEIAVKKSEVMINKELQERIEKQDFIIQTLTELNKKFLDKIIDLRLKLKKLINE